MKKLIILGFLCGGALCVNAADFSYTIINNVSDTEVKLSISDYLTKTQYTCSLQNYSCVKNDQIVKDIEKNPITEITIASITKLEEEREAVREQEKLNTNQTETSTTTSEKNKYEPFILPKEVLYVKKSPDGSKIAYYTNTPGMVKKERTFYVQDLSGKIISHTTTFKNWDLINDFGKVFEWTKDGSKLVYIDDRDGSPKPYLIDFSKNPANLEGQLLVEKKYTVNDFIIGPDNILYIVANRNALYTWGIFGISLDGKSSLITVSKDVMYTNDLYIKNYLLLFNPQSKGASTLAAYNLIDKQVHHFTGIEYPQLIKNTYTYKVLRTKDITGIVVEPNKKISPKNAIIWMHGGPYRQTAKIRHSYQSYGTFDWILDQMSNENTLILKIDYPGSYGLGSAYAGSLSENVGKTDVLAVKEAVRYLKDRGVEHVYLFGNSYGGYLTAKGLVELNQALDGGLAIAAVTDWAEIEKKWGPLLFEAHFGGGPNEQTQKLYDRASIVTPAQEKLTKPLILMAGSLDRQVPYEQSEFLLKELTKQGKNIKYYSIKDEKHVFAGVSQLESICTTLAGLINIHSTNESFCKIQK